MLVVAPDSGRVRRTPLVEGALLRAGDVVARVDAGSRSADVRAPAAGIFLGWMAWDNESVTRGVPVARIEASPERRPAVVGAPGGDDVHVWRLRLDDVESDHPEPRRHRLTRRRDAIRRLLATYAGEEPGALRIVRDERGKPHLAAEADNRIHFSVSDCDGLALLAVAADADVGVDVERIRPIRGWERLAERWLSGGSREAIDMVEPAMRGGAFLGEWTRREAVLKACGTGLPGSVFCGGRGSWKEPEEASVAVHTLERVAEGWVGAVARVGTLGSVVERDGAELT